MNQRVGGPVQLLALLLIIKDKRGQNRPVERAVRIENIGPERIAKRRKPFPSGAGKLAAELIRVHDGRAKIA